MGCANSKASGTTGAYGAPEEEGAAPPKVMVDGEAQDGAVAANGNAVSCANGLEEDTAAEDKEACNGDHAAKSEENTDAPSSEDKSDQNGGCENEASKSIQDGGGEADDNNEEKQTEEEGAAKEDENIAEATDSSENVESRDTNEEEKAE